MKRSEVPRSCREGVNLIHACRLLEEGAPAVLVEIRAGLARLLTREGTTAQVPAVWVRLRGLLHGPEAGPHHQTRVGWWECPSCGARVPEDAVIIQPYDDEYLCRACAAEVWADWDAHWARGEVLCACCGEWMPAGAAPQHCCRCRETAA